MQDLIWQKVAEGENAAFAEMYKCFFKKLFNYGRKFTENEMLIEDTIQESFVTIWHYKERLPNIDAPKSYLFTLFRNALIKRLKEEERLLKKDKSDLYEPEFSIESILIKSEIDGQLKQELRKVIKELPARQREAIFLRFYEGMPYEQIAEIMQISLNASYKTVSKGLIHLRDKLGIPIALLPLLLACAQK